MSRVPTPVFRVPYPVSRVPKPPENHSLETSAQQLVVEWDEYDDDGDDVLSEAQVVKDSDLKLKKHKYFAIGI